MLRLLNERDQQYEVWTVLMLLLQVLIMYSNLNQCNAKYPSKED